MQPLTELGHGSQDQTWGPLCWEEGQADIYLPDVEYSHPYEEGPLPPIEGWLNTLIAPEMMTTTRTGVDNNQTVTTQQPGHEDMLTEEKGAVECRITPRKQTAIDSMLLFVITCL